MALISFPPQKFALSPRHYVQRKNHKVRTSVFTKFIFSFMKTDKLIQEVLMSYTQKTHPLLKQDSTKSKFLLI